ncbi:MAG TPA: GspMb/PilO family protein [Verrucomicrobiae bacterium]
MKIKNRQRFLKRLTYAAAALYIGVNWVFMPLQGWWGDRQKQIHDLRARVTEGNQLLRRETSIRNHWGDMQTNSLAASTAGAEHEVLTALTRWSRDSGAEITSIMPQWKNDSTNYMTLACRVEAAGDLGSLSKFIYDLEKGPLALRVDSVELSAHDNSGQQMTLGMEINGLALLNNDKKK